MIEGVRKLTERRGATELLVVLTAQYVVIGALDLIYVVLAAEVFGLGPAGPGLLGAMFGAGALIGAAGSTLLVARRRLTPVLLASLTAICVALVVMAAWAVLAVAIVARLAVSGVSRSVLDVTGRMLLQRSAPQHALASVFATLEALALLGCLVGSVIAQVGIALVGVRTALAALAAVLTATVVWSARQLAHVDEIADAPVFEIRLLRRLALFAPLPAPALEGVRERPDRASSLPGSQWCAEGDVGDEYYAIVEGEVDVTLRGRHVRRMSRVRVSARSHCSPTCREPPPSSLVPTSPCWRSNAGPFLTAVTGHDASQRAAWDVARAWHPALRRPAGDEGGSSGVRQSDDVSREHISQGSSFERRIGYSRAVVDGRWVFVSGTTGYDYASMTISDDVVEQCRQTLANIDDALTRAGSCAADVVQVDTCFRMPTTSSRAGQHFVTTSASPRRRQR